MAVLVAMMPFGDAMAQQVSGMTTKHHGIATPPSGTVPPQPKRLNHSNASTPGNNTPNLPELARQPDAPIGSPVTIAGPGGTVSHPLGN